MSDKIAVQFDEKKIDAIFADLDQCRLPGAAVGISIYGTQVYRKGFGLASMELPVLLSPTIRMRVASVTKHFASLTYMLLCEECKAGIDDPVGKYLPELHPVAHKVTFRQLMGNISGLRDVHDISWQFSGTVMPVSSANLLSLYRDIDDVAAVPGATWIYNNGGFLILSAAIERITGQSLEVVLRERIFDPLGMFDTLLRRWDTDFLPNSATAHMTNCAGGYEKSNFFGTAWAGEGGMVSTVNDMLRWLAHMDAPIIGSAATWHTLWAPQTLDNGMSTGYGLGLVSAQYRGVRTVYHPGGGLGSNAWMLKVPAAGLNVIVMVNRQDVHSGTYVYKILDACLPNLDPVKEESSLRVRGIFRSSITGRVIQLRPASSAIPPWIKEGQQIALIDGFDIPVSPDDEGVFWPEGIHGYMRLGLTLPLGPAEPISLRLSDFGNVDNLMSVQRAEEVDLGSIIGRYRSDATGTDATISEHNERPTMSTVGRFGSAAFNLECLAKGIWRARSASSMPHGCGILSFNDDGSAFRFFSLRTRALTFLRCAHSL